MIAISDKGVSGDYNHYRTVALKSTANRAVSILTQDVSSYILTLDGGSFASGSSGNGYTDGDLGENILVEGVDFSYFKIGQRYRFTQQKATENEQQQQGGVDALSIIMEDVIVEITIPNQWSHVPIYANCRS